MEKVVNGTAVSIGGRGVLLLGESGSGKSDLAFRLIDRGATLISDDRVLLEKKGEGVLLKPHPEIIGKLEVRGVGILDFQVCAAPLHLVVRLSQQPYERLPEKMGKYEVMGFEIAETSLNPFEISCPLKLERLVF